MKYCPDCGKAIDTREHEGRIYQACSCGFTNWNNPTPVVAAIVELNGHVILVHHKTWPEKMLGLVTGFLEEGEDPSEAVQREVAEELGLRVLSVNLIGAYGFSHQNQVIIAYHVSCEGDVVLNDELDGFKALLPEKVKPWEFGTGPAVKDWLISRQSD